jgi:hypothetical protein
VIHVIIDAGAESGLSWIIKLRSTSEFMANEKQSKSMMQATFEPPIPDSPVA